MQNRERTAVETAGKIRSACEWEWGWVDLNRLLKSLGIEAYPYQGNEGAIRALGLERACRVAEGMTFFRDEVPVVLFNARNPPWLVRFTVAHELGHLVLGHLYSEREPEEEQEADLFAMELLRPKVRECRPP